MVKLQAVTDQVLKQLADLRWISMNRRQRADFNRAAGLPDQPFKVGNNLDSDGGQVNKQKAASWS